MGFVTKFKRAFGLDEEYYDENEEYYDDVDDVSEEESPKRGFFSKFKREEDGERPVNNAGKYDVTIFKPTSVEDSREMADVLLDGDVCIINFEGINTEVAQRVIDFVAGVCYALDGNLKSISTYVFVASPAEIDLVGEETPEDKDGFKPFSASEIHGR